VRNDKRVKVKWLIVKGRDHLEDLSAEGKMLLIGMLQNQDKRP
jgi:hypothetical protein